MSQYTIGGLPARDRQRLGTVGVHLNRGRSNFVPHIGPPNDDSDICVVEPVDGLVIQTEDPECFEILATVFEQAAKLLREHAATEVANLVRDEDMQS